MNAGRCNARYNTIFILLYADDKVADRISTMSTIIECRMTRIERNLSG